MKSSSSGKAVIVTAAASGALTGSSTMDSAHTDFTRTALPEGGIAMTNTQQNKQVANGLIDLAFNQQKPEEAIERYIGARYVQHDPATPDGKEGLLKIAKDAIEQYGRVDHEIVRTIADGDLVAVHSRVTFGKPMAGAEHGMAVVDIFRLEDGKIVEHWDVRTPIPMPEQALHGNSMV